MSATLGTGTTLSQGTTTPVLIGSITQIGGVEQSADSHETTTLAVTDGYKTFIPGLKDAGQLQVDGFFDGADAGQKDLQASFDNGTVDAYAVTFPAATKTTFAFNAFVEKLEAVGQADNKNPIPFKATFKISGKPTITTTA